MLAEERVRACRGRARMGRCRAFHGRRAPAIGPRGLLGARLRLDYIVYRITRSRKRPSRPVTTLPEPSAVLPALPDRGRLLDIFLAKRNPRTPAACKADLEDFRRFIGGSSVYAPTVGKAVEW